MEWRPNLLGMAKNGAASSPFGALGGAGGVPPQQGAMPGMPGQPPQMPPAAPPVPFMNPTTGQPAPTPGAPQPGNPLAGIPGLLGKLMSGQQGGNNQGALVNQAMSMLRPAQLLPTQPKMPWTKQ